MSLEIRDLSKDKVFSLFDMVKQQAAIIGKQTDTWISLASQFSGLPAMTDETIQNLIALSAKELGYSFKHMPSSAGHDAQDMANIAPTGMIFVPGKDGISHSPLEYTSPQDRANGANVLFSTILKPSTACPHKESWARRCKTKGPVSGPFILLDEFCTRYH